MRILLLPLAILLLIMFLTGPVDRDRRADVMAWVLTGLISALCLVAALSGSSG